MSKKFDCLNQKGFTLIELFSVMIIMGVVASVSIQKFGMVSDTASERALHLGIKELNIRESLAWSNLKISTDGYTTDEELYIAIDTKLGDIYKWDPDPPDRLTGGKLSFKSTSKTLDRQESTTSSAGQWN
ncbi:MAG: prepilin-type N-terminal cleavage/methylation domain-containing protein [Desulfobacterales bacterium]|nr:prepilin-type N-terminal cleavage/methylation domain-containing protein [Desulfobacterales bacterium]